MHSNMILETFLFTYINQKKWCVQNFIIFTMRNYINHMNIYIILHILLIKKNIITQNIYIK